MADSESIYSRCAPWLLSVLRIIAAFLFMLHGSQKLFGFPVNQPFPAFPLFSLLGVAGILEFFGGFLLLIGVFTRITAFVLSGQMAVAYFMQHAPKGFWPVLNQGELAVIFCFIFLYLSAAGAGPLSVDAHWRCELATDPSSTG